jgi:hypothetical protein
MAHRKDAEYAEIFFIKTISQRPLRLCGEILSDQGIRQSMS